MKERPILFNAPMVRALLEGRKTQTRRIVKFEGDAPKTIFPLLGRDNAPTGEWFFADPVYERVGRSGHFCPYGKSGDRLWVKETWTSRCWDEGDKRIERVCYGADAAQIDCVPSSEWKRPQASLGAGWVTPLFMPRWASRIALEVTEVRVQRLQEISEEDAIAEGIQPNWLGDLKVGPNGFGGEGWVPECGWWHYTNSVDGEPAYTAVESYQSLWESIHGAGSWTANPWVWAVSFPALWNEE